MLIQLFKGETKLKAKLKMNVFKRQTMVPLTTSWIPMADIKYCQVINILPFNSKFSSALVLKEMLQLICYLIWYLITVTSTVANIEERTFRKEKDHLKSGFVKGVISATLSISIPFKAFHYPNNMYIKFLCYKMGSFCIIHSRVKEKNTSWD